MIWTTVIGGLSLGAIGSMHCIGMCGPLALALPIHHLKASRKFQGILLYQLGRVTTYSLLGLVFGIVGRRLYLAGIQQWLSISLGVAIVLSVLFAAFMRKPVKAGFLYRFYIRVQQVIGHLLKMRKGYFHLYLIGIANGLLPCGMVYIAIAAALSSSAVTTSVLFMAFFGLGTLPAMMLLVYFGKMAPLSLRYNMRRIMPYIVATMGFLLILRGLNLDIPFISPVLPAQPASAVSCHS